MADSTERRDAQQPAGERTPGQVVLFVDDEEALRTCMCAVLKHAGYLTIQACNGQEAVRILQNRHVDLLITDLIMPEREGIETILYVRKNFPDLNVIAISGGDSIRLTVAKKLGARAVLCKPFSAGALVAAADSVCCPVAPPGSVAWVWEEDSAWRG